VNLARYGTTLVFVVLAVIAILFALGGHWILAFVFAIVAFGSWFVRGVRRSTGR
jgi:hypothetical protein